MLHVTGYKLYESHRGFTILESVAVIGILVVAASFAFVSMKQSRNKPALEETRILLLEALEGARSRSAHGAGTVDHGVHIETGQFVVFEGSIYPSPTSTTRLFPSGVASDNSSTTIVFKRLNALPSATATIVLTNSDGATTSVQITETGAVIGM